MSDARTIHQPLHPSLVDRLDPVYRTFHEQTVQFIPRIEELPWEVAKKARGAPPLPGGGELEAFEKTKDWMIDEGRIGMRAWWPRGDKPAGAWPIMIW